jgi:hypothetical protein
LSVEQRAFVFAEMCMKGDLGEKLRDEKSLVPKTSMHVFTAVTESHHYTTLKAF